MLVIVSADRGARVPRNNMPERGSSGLFREGSDYQAEDSGYRKIPSERIDCSPSLLPRKNKTRGSFRLDASVFPRKTSLPIERETLSANSRLRSRVEFKLRQRPREMYGALNLTWRCQHRCTVALGFA